MGVVSLLAQTLHTNTLSGLPTVHVEVPIQEHGIPQVSGHPGQHLKTVLADRNRTGDRWMTGCYLYSPPLYQLSYAEKPI